MAETTTVTPDHESKHDWERYYTDRSEQDRAE